MDLSNSQNWLLVSQQSKRVVEISAGITGRSKYIPLEPTGLQVSSPILITYLDSNDAPNYWIKGGWASLYAQINGQATKVGQRNLRLFENNLLNFPYFGEELIPFTLKIEFPWWIKDISLKVWEFQDSSGRYVPSNIEQSLLDLEDKLNGETIALQLVSSTPLQDGDATLYQNVYEGKTKYSSYEVGRFKLGSQSLSDPIIEISPNRLLATFTGKNFIEGEITVSVKPL